MSTVDFFKQPTLVEGSQPHTADVPLPRQIGPYTIESLLDTGGMSLLYLAIHPETHEPVIIKVLSPKFVSHPEVVSRFLQESQIIAMTDHPNIVKLYNQGEWEGGLYIAMEFIQGISLRQMIIQNALTLKRALEIVLQIAYALFHLHAHGVIHRDLKPENIILTESGGVKVIDFGIAQLHEEKEIAPAAKVMGTPIYMSPEQRTSAENVGYTADIYSLGVITYELALGKLSHGNIHLSLLPLGLQKILQQALQPDPAKRYQDIVDFITDVSNYLESPEFTSESGTGNVVGALYEDIRSAQTRFLSPQPPDWPKIELGFTQSSNLAITSAYTAFFTLPDSSYAIVLAQPVATGAGGLLCSCILKGLFLNLQNTLHNPPALATQLNTLFYTHFEDQILLLSLLILDPARQMLRYLSCGFGPLWITQNGRVKQLSADNIALGITGDTEFVEVSSPWSTGDRLLLHSYKVLENHEGAASSPREEELKAALLETLFLAPQKQVEAILRKIQPAPSTNEGFESASTCLISVGRKA